MLKLHEMDAGQLKNSIEYKKRNNMFIGNLLLMNHYGKGLELTFDNFLSGKYKRKIRGFLK